MGAWGFGSFENDDAADFLSDVAESADLSLLQEIFAIVLSSTEYVEAADASQAIAAAEIVAAALGRSTEAGQQEEQLTTWLARARPRVGDELVAQAGDALARIVATHSELRELWEEADEFSEWLAAVDDLRQQLQLRPN